MVAKRKLKPKRKTVWMLVRVTVPTKTTAAQARREVRTLVNEQCNYSLDPEDVRAIVVRAVSNGGCGDPRRTALGS